MDAALTGAARTHWPAVAAVFAAGLAIALNVGKVPVALPPLRAELGLSLVQAGWVASMLTSMALLFGAFVGTLVGRIGALRMVLAGLLVCAAGSAGPLLLPARFEVLLASRVVEGLGFMCVAVSCPALISVAAGPADRRFALGLWSAYMPAGAGLAMALSPALLPRAGWPSLWVLACAGLLAASAAVWWQRHRLVEAGAACEPSQAAPELALAGFWGPVREVLARPLPWLLALAFGMWAIQHFALIVWMPTYLREVRGAGAGLTALLTGVMLLACVPGNILGGSLVQRGLPRGLLIAGAHVLTGAGALVYTADSLDDGTRYAAAVFVSFAGGVIPAAVMASTTVMARSPQQIGTLQGMYLQGAQMGQFVGTPLIAAVVAATGLWRASLWVTGVAAAAGILLGLAARRHEPALRLGFP